MKLFALNFSTLILRFYFLMAIVIGAFFMNLPWLAFLALPVFISAMMGIRFSGIRTSAKTIKAGHAPQKAFNAPQSAHS